MIRLISFINRTLGTKDKLTCVSRPRRFGKSFATQMLCAYYDKSCDSKTLFSDLEIAADSAFSLHLNQYNVIYLDITWFISTAKNIKTIIPYLQKQVIEELCNLYCLKDAIISMLGGAKYKINTRTFQNDITSIKSKDDVLTLLVHLGYLAYDSNTKEVYIPNQEVAEEFKNAVENSGWEGISAALQASDALLEATIRQDEQIVEKRLDEITYR